MCIATQIKCKHSKPTDTTPKNSSNQQIAHLHITPQNTHFQQKSTIQNLPSREGLGVCHVRAQLPQIKCKHPKPTNTTLPNSSKIIASQPAHLTITHPLIPSQEGNLKLHKSLITKKKAPSQNSPLERGRGCVTHVHSHPNQMQTLKADRHHPKKLLKPTNRTSPYHTTNHSLPRRKHHPKTPLSRGAGGVSRPSTATSNQMLPPEANKRHISKQQKNNLIPARTPHRNTPLNPLSRGESKITQITHYQEESSIQNLPSREGRGVCHVRAQLPQIKCYHTKPRKKHLKPANSASKKATK